MENKIEKLVKEYQEKINTTSKAIDFKQSEIRDAKSQNQFGYTSQLKTELKILYAKEQAYVQAKHDIDSLLD